jgi:exopolysaccharide biosynthesis polyprenyl glycosylphosphotransferase
MKRRSQSPLILLLLDCLVIVGSFNALQWLRGVMPVGVWVVEPLIVPAILTIAAIYLIDGYRSRTEMMSADYTSQHFVAISMTALVTLLLTFVFNADGTLLDRSRGVIALSFTTIAVVTLSYRRSIHRWHEQENADRTVLFLGDRASCENFRVICESNGMHQKIICAITGELTEPPIQIQGGESLSSYREVISDIQAGKVAVEAIVIKESSQSIQTALADDLTELYFKGVPTFTLELFFETYWRKIPLYRINHTWLFQEGFEIARTPVFERTKRLVDITLASVGLITSLPFLALAAIFIKLTDGGSILFRQQRVGRNRETFTILKLRTMTTVQPDSLKGDARYTHENDPRITRVGAFLRKSRLDEVPQLWNVITGDMSLIGPRAEWVELVTEYQAKIPCYHFRHLVRPGVTGWAQINYPYGASIEDTLRKLEYDLYYIRHFSFVMDASIVLRTIHLMLFGKGR